jgi:pimeloyl-ACP methyl ester carboxylesterase
MLKVILTVFFVLVVVKCSAIFLGYLVYWLHARPTGQDETVYARTSDGWRLALHRYHAEGPTIGFPVILCHGLSANRYAFDLPAAPSLASFLKKRGRDVWVVELRGSGMSDRPRLFYSDVPYSWGFEDHLRYDVPAILDCVLKCTGSPLAHWVGHSMGGMLVLAYVSGRRDPRLASAVALGSPTDFAALNKRIFEFLLKMKSLLKFTPLSPFPCFVRLSAPLAPWAPSRLFGIFQPKNVGTGVARKVVALMTEPLSPSTLWLDFGRFLETGRFSPNNGEPYLEGLNGSPVPILCVAGSWDQLAPPESIATAGSNTGHVSERSRLILGKDTGFQEDYGHVDLIVGLRVENELFPRIFTWLAAHDNSGRDSVQKTVVPPNAG